MQCLLDMSEKVTQRADMLTSSPLQDWYFQANSCGQLDPTIKHMCRCLSHSPQTQQLLSTYTDICRDAAGPAAESDEFLYGRAGTLFGALLLRQQIAQTAVPADVVGALVDSLLSSGGF